MDLKSSFFVNIVVFLLRHLGFNGILLRTIVIYFYRQSVFLIYGGTYKFHKFYKVIRHCFIS